MQQERDERLASFAALAALPCDEREWWRQRYVEVRKTWHDLPALQRVSAQAKAKNQLAADTGRSWEEVDVLMREIESELILERIAKQEDARLRLRRLQRRTGRVPRSDRLPFERGLDADLLAKMPMTRQRGVTRESTPRKRTRTASASRGGELPSADDDPDLANQRTLLLDRQVRKSLRREIDRRRRQQLVGERDHLRVVPADGWAA